jgi:hypothetical protein
MSMMRPRRARHVTRIVDVIGVVILMGCDMAIVSGSLALEALEQFGNQ